MLESVKSCCKTRIIGKEHQVTNVPESTVLISSDNPAPFSTKHYRHHQS